jgi:hypothetical protein
MKITSHIVGLLYDNECVVVPGLGGFITKVHAAENHPVKHQFKPPYKRIVFNASLRSNDGVLINRVARAGSISYLEARELVDKDVAAIISQLGSGAAVDMPGLGVLTITENNEIEFEQDTKFNYLASSFGLTAFVSPAIKRDDFQLRLKQKHASLASGPRPTRKFKPGRRTVKSLVAGSLLALFIGGLVWGMANPKIVSNYYHTYAGLIPFFYSSPNEYLASNLELIPIVTPIVSADDHAETADFEIDEPIHNQIVTPTEQGPEVVEAGPDIVETEPYEIDAAASLETKPDLLANASPAPEPAAEIAESLPVEAETGHIPRVCLNNNQTQTRYYIIAGAFREPENADNLTEYLRAKGFNVGCAGQTSGGLWRISYEATNSWAHALERLAIIKQEEDEHAWLYSAN